MGKTLDTDAKLIRINKNQYKSNFIELISKNNPKKLYHL